MPGHQGHVDYISQDLWSAASATAWAGNPRHALEDWLNHSDSLRSIQRQFRETSRETYRYILQTWFDALEAQHKTLFEATALDLESFLSDRDQPLDAVSRRRYLQLIARLHDDLTQLQAHHNPANPLLARERALTPPPPACLTQDELRRMTQVLSQGHGQAGRRDRALASLLVGAGLRVNEVITLQNKDWPTAPGWYIRITPQGIHRQHTTTVLNQSPWRQWLAEHPVGLADQPAITTKGKHAMSPSGVFLRVKAWLNQAGIDTENGGGPHRLRNTFAHLAAAEGRSIPALVEALGVNEARAVRKILRAPD